MSHLKIDRIAHTALLARSRSPSLALFLWLLARESREKLAEVPEEQKSGRAYGHNQDLVS